MLIIVSNAYHKLRLISAWSGIEKEKAKFPRGTQRRLIWVPCPKFITHVTCSFTNQDSMNFVKMHMIFHSSARKKKKKKTLQKQTRRDKEKFFAISAGSVLYNTLL